MDSLKLKFWAQNKYNVLFEGRHGTGKTASVKEVFNELYGVQGVDWLYFSAATMDAFVDFVGVPREVVDEDGTRYLELIRPRALAKDTVKAIFLDEFNRAPSKTRNAVMELLQFKSINGKRFESMQVIWAAINPEEDGLYDVERMDPAQQDRFDVHVKVEYDVNKDYFFDKFGKLGEVACDWWRSQEEEVQFAISPRRLETVVRMFNDEGDISDILPKSLDIVNTTELITQFQDGAYLARLKTYIASNDKAGAKEALVSENFYHGVESEILNYAMHQNTYIEFFVPIMPNEKIAKIFAKDSRVRDWMTEKLHYYDFSHIFDSIIAVNSTPQQRQATGVQTSMISKLKLWKMKSGGNDLLSDMDYIDNASDTRLNITFFRTQDDAREKLLERLTKIIDNNNNLTHNSWLKVLGPMVELYYSSSDVKMLPTVKANLVKLRDIFETRLDTKFRPLLTHQLPGLRTAGNETAFKNAINNLIKDGLVDGTV